MINTKLEKPAIDPTTLDKLKEELKNELGRVLAESKVAEIVNKYGTSFSNLFQLGLIINSSLVDTICSLDSSDVKFSTYTCEPKTCYDEEGNAYICGCK